MFYGECFRQSPYSKSSRLLHIINAMLVWCHTSLGNNEVLSMHLSLRVEMLLPAQIFLVSPTGSLDMKCEIGCIFQSFFYFKMFCRQNRKLFVSSIIHIRAFGESIEQNCISVTVSTFIWHPSSPRFGINCCTCLCLLLSVTSRFDGLGTGQVSSAPLCSLSRWTGSEAKGTRESRASCLDLSSLWLLQPLMRPWHQSLFEPPSRRLASFFVPRHKHCLLMCTYILLKHIIRAVSVQTV